MKDFITAKERLTFDLDCAGALKDIGFFLGFLTFCILMGATT